MALARPVLCDLDVSRPVEGGGRKLDCSGLRREQEQRKDGVPRILPKGGRESVQKADGDIKACL